MRNVIVSEYLTLDGVMEEPGTWSFPFWNDELATYKYDELFASGALLLGRITYQGFAAAWPTMTGTGDFGERMNSLPKFVASRTLDAVEWNASLIAGDVAQEVARLKEQPGQDLLVAGSGELARTLMHHDLIDEYRFLVHPVVLGSGKRLFTDGNNTTLRLVEMKTFSSGVIALSYKPTSRS